MNKKLVILLALLLCAALCGCSDAKQTAAWEQAFYLDPFNDPTDERYIGTGARLTGTYSSASVTDGKLEAELAVDAEKISVALYEGGKDRVKNGLHSAIAFPVTVKRADGTTFTAEGFMPSGGDSVIIEEAQAERILAAGETAAPGNFISAALCQADGEVSFYLTRSDLPASSYLFRVKCANFAQLYDAEIAQPMLSSLYARAEELYTGQDYAGAAEAFAALGSYKDSAAKKTAAEDALYAPAYAAAEALLRTGQYQQAIEAFAALGDYKDSAAQKTAAQDILYAPVYASAESLLRTGQIEQAIGAFDVLGDYRDSAAKADELYEQVKAELFAAASVGSTVVFGRGDLDMNSYNGRELIHWLVLAQEEGRLLVVSSAGLAAGPYHEAGGDVAGDDVTWESCSLRQWLNAEFMDAAFTEAERAMIPTVTVTADPNPKYNTDPGNDTQDQLFLLSIPEVQAYFPTVADARCEPTLAARLGGAWINDSNDCWWWLRTPGYPAGNAAYVYSDDGVYRSGYGVDDAGGTVRPAMWIELPA